MSKLNDLLSRLDKVKQTKPGSYVASCSAHADRNPSLNIRELDDGRILIHCFAGCETNDVLAAVDMDMSDLYPQSAIQHRKPERSAFPAADVLCAISFEVLFIAAVGVAILDRQEFSTEDRERLILAVSRIQSAMAVAGVGNA